MITFITILVTPEMARFYLSLNINKNRRISQKAVYGHARDMVNGSFVGNGDVIRFSDNHVAWDPNLGRAIGNMLDGQHRMEAVILSGVPVTMSFALDIPPEAFKTIDTGRVRGFNDVLSFRGQKNANNAAALTRKMYAWDQGVRVLYNTGVKITHAELEEYWDKHEADLHAATQYGVSGGKVGPVTGGNLSVAHILFTRVNNEMAIEYLDGLVTGAGLPAKSAAYVLRERLNRNQREIGRDRMSPTDELYLIVRGWNAYRTNETVLKFQLPQGGVTQESMVIPI